MALAAAAATVDTAAVEVREPCTAMEAMVEVVGAAAQAEAVVTAEG